MFVCMNLYFCVLVWLVYYFHEVTGLFPSSKILSIFPSVLMSIGCVKIQLGTLFGKRSLIQLLFCARQLYMDMAHLDR
jgi:hypothetical protein